MTPEDAEKILNLPMQQPNDAGAETVRSYLQELLSTVIVEGEGFSGKRPFGNSGWEYDLHFPLVQAKLVKGKIFDGGVTGVDEEKAKKLILQAINIGFRGNK